MDYGRDPEDILATRAEDAASQAEDIMARRAEDPPLDPMEWRDPPEAWGEPPQSVRPPQTWYEDTDGFYAEPDEDAIQWALEASHADADYALEEGIREQAEERARRYLIQNGEAVWVRVERSLDEARTLVDTHPGPSLVAGLTGAELLIRFLLLRPMLAGMVFHDQLAEHLIHTPFERRTWLDRDLLPFACGAWELDLAGLRIDGDDGDLAWPALKNLWLVRDAYVHRAEQARPQHAQLALRCIQALMDGLLEPLAQRLRLAWPVSEWPEDVERRDPLTAKPKPPDS